MMTYSQPLSNYNYCHYPINTSKPSARKQFVSEPKYLGSSPDTSVHAPYSSGVAGANPRTLPPYLSVQRASEPASPATIATTISSSHSTPSPSPSRLPNLATATTHDTDFTLFDDAIVAVQQDISESASKGRVGIDLSSTMSEAPQTLNAYSSTGFPIIVPHDAPYPGYTHTGIYNNYAAGSFNPSDTNGTIYNFNSDERASQSPLQHLATNKALRPSSRGGSAGIGRQSGPSIARDVESIENVPALSPTTKQRSRLSPNHQNNRPSSPLSPTTRIGSQNSNLSGPNYLHSVMPKLGRTFSDAAQDELYNPDLSRHGGFNTTHFSKHKQSSKLKSSEYEGKQETRTSLPQIFQEAQQQHEQDLYRSGVHDAPPRDQSPFRHNSPFHPTNTAGFPTSYGGQTHQIPENDITNEINQSQYAMALALGEQIQKGSHQTPAPKTISPRDSLLEYNEPENPSDHLNLFPPAPGNRIIAGTNSIHGSQDGSDVDDFHSMATSRRGSVATSSASSHLEVPRFSMMQPSYDAPSAPYYYADSTVMGGALPLMDQQFIKSESAFNPIPRPIETSANSGTYTCTYSGCGHRFTTSTKLQKHRRESHRKTAPSGNSVSTAAAIANRNAQPGPHRCMRVNPSTGKPCNTVFSRPYDLTRHEDTIHNSAKAKVRCEICNDDKTFSRGDALVRHRRVKHNIS